MDNLAHKMVHTFGKMDTINPTFELMSKMKVHSFYLRDECQLCTTLTIYSGLSHLFNKRTPILTQLQMNNYTEGTKAHS